MRLISSCGPMILSKEESTNIVVSLFMIFSFPNRKSFALKSHCRGFPFTTFVDRSAPIIELLKFKLQNTKTQTFTGEMFRVDTSQKEFPIKVFVLVFVKPQSKPILTQSSSFVSILEVGDGFQIGVIEEILMSAKPSPRTPS